MQCLVHIWSSLSPGGCLAGALGAGKSRQIPFAGLVSPSPGTGGEGEQKRQSSHRSKQSQECLKEAATAGGDCLVCPVLPGIPVQLELWHFAL